MASVTNIRYGSMRGTRNSRMVVSWWPWPFGQVCACRYVALWYWWHPEAVVDCRLPQEGLEKVEKWQRGKVTSGWRSDHAQASPRSLKPTVLPRAKMPPADCGSEAPMEFHQRERDAVTSPSFLCLFEKMQKLRKFLRGRKLHYTRGNPPRQKLHLFLSFYLNETNSFTQFMIDASNFRMCSSSPRFAIQNILFWSCPSTRCNKRCRYLPKCKIPNYNLLLPTWNIPFLLQSEVNSI